jgi:DNA-binding response OmpR family regulator
VIAPFPDRHDNAVHQTIDDLAKAIARELLQGLRNSAVIEAVAHQADGVFHVGPLTVDTVRHETTWRGEHIDLKRREFALLAFLAQNSGHAFTREQLLELVWPSAVATEIESDCTVDVHIRRLRVKLGKEAAQLIRTIVGIGYKLQVQRGESA